MTSARERYQNDAAYRSLVQMLEAFIQRCEFTPSELREACILASINYEMYTIRSLHIPMTKDLHERLEQLHEIVDAHKREQP